MNFSDVIGDRRIRVRKEVGCNDLRVCTELSGEDFTMNDARISEKSIDLRCFSLTIADIISFIIL